jgi:hypothetical protein
MDFLPVFMLVIGIFDIPILLILWSIAHSDFDINGMVIFGCGEGTVEVQLVCASLDTQQESDS